MIYIAVPDMNDSVSRITLSGKEFYIRFCYNPSYDYWSFGLYDIRMNPILPMVKIVPFSPLLYFYRYTELPDGQFGCFSAKRTNGTFQRSDAGLSRIEINQLIERIVLHTHLRTL